MIAAPQQGVVPVELQAGRPHDSTPFVDDEEPREVLRDALDRQRGSREQRLDARAITGLG